MTLEFVRIINSLDKVFSKRVIFISLFLITFIIYLATISKAYEFDSISLAIWAEKGFFYLKGQQHHVLLTLINAIFYRLSSQLFHFQSALLPLSILGCFLGALGNAVFFRTLNILLRDKVLAVLGALCLAFSFNYWRYSVLIETHILPTFFLICVLHLLVLTENLELKRNIIFAGIFTSLSFFSSGANIIFLPAFLVLLGLSSLPRPRENIAPLGIYLKTLLIYWLIPFLLFGLIVLLTNIYMRPKVVLSSHNIIVFYFNWFKGQLCIENSRADYLFIISGKIIESIFSPKISTMTLILFCSFIILSFINKKKEVLSRHLNVLLSSLVAIAIFFCVFLFYEPDNLQRYTPLLIFLWPSICLLLRKKSILALIALFLFINNLVFVIWPEHKEENNICLQEALLLREVANPRDIIVVRSRWPSTQLRYMPYFTGCATFSLADKGLMDKIASTLSSRYKVFVTEDVLDPDEPVKKEALDLIKTHYSVIQYTVKGKIKIYQITAKAGKL